LSNTASRSSTGTGSRPSSPVTRATNSTIARFAGPSRQVDSPSATPEDASSVVAMNRTLGDMGGLRHHPDRMIGGVRSPGPPRLVPIG